jgi:mannose/fructose-specific phosphotransferase system component IIA
MNEERVRGLIVAHSSLASALVATVQQIAGGDAEALQAISNEGRGPGELLDAVREAAGDHPVIIFTDMGSGSCAFAARKLAIERPNTGIICGVNLPLLLDFVFHRDLPLQALIDRLVEKGRGGISGACTEEIVHADRALSR